MASLWGVCSHLHASLEVQNQFFLLFKVQFVASSIPVRHGQFTGKNFVAWIYVIFVLFLPVQPNHGRLQTKIVSSKEKASPRSHCVSTTLFLSIVKSYYPSLTSHSLLTESLPESWMMAASDPLTVVKLRVVPQVPHPRVDTLITVAVHDHFGSTDQ